MKLRIVTVSSRPPQWIQQGYDEYARRLPREFSLDLVEIKPEARGTSTPGVTQMLRMKTAEAARIRPHLSGFERVVAMDERGTAYSTVALAELIQGWQAQAQDAVFVIGGADGLAEELKHSAQLRMSLSAMTLPHQFVRVMLAEQLYRAVSILNKHPYHRI